MGADRGNVMQLVVGFAQDCWPFSPAEPIPRPLTEALCKIVTGWNPILRNTGEGWGTHL
jgi:hypothetical protein